MEGIDEVTQRDIRLGPHISVELYREFRALIARRGWTITWTIAAMMRLMVGLEPQEFEKMADALESVAKEHPRGNRIRRHQDQRASEGV